MSFVFLAVMPVTTWLVNSWPPGPPGEEFLVTINHQAAPLDLAGATATAEIKLRKEDNTPVGSFTVDIKNQTTNTGEVGLKLTSVVTAALAARQYPWDLQVRWSGTENTTVLTGLVNATRDVTAP